MKTTIYYKFKATIAFCLGVIMLVSACKDENEMKGFFALEGAPAKMDIPADGSSETYKVKATGHWKVEPLRKEHWLKIEPMEGNGDDTFTVTVDKNTEEEARTLALLFTVDGQLQNSVLKIEQAAAKNEDEEKDPYVKIDGILERLELPESGIAGDYTIRATGKWKIALEEDADWVTLTPREGTGDTPIKLTIDKNTDLERTVNLLFFLDDVKQANPVTIYQKGIKLQVPGDVVLKEDFNWLNYGSTVFNVTDGETRISSWSAAEQEKGWTSTINPTEGGGNYASIYARQGFVKLGRTNYGGDLISPELSNVQGTKNLSVSFKAAVYMTGRGAVDHNVLKVGVTGPGTVNVEEFAITLKPDYAADPTCVELWKKPEATKEFVITGATKDTKIWFLGGNFDLSKVSGWPKTTNRIFIDDVVITVR